MVGTFIFFSALVCARATHGPLVGHRAKATLTMTNAAQLPMAHVHALQLRQMDCLTVAWAMKNPRKSLILVRLAGIEPTTLGFGGQYSIH